MERRDCSHKEHFFHGGQERCLCGACDGHSTQDYESAASILVNRANAASSTGVVGHKWLMSAAEHLARKVHESFREGPKVTTEQQAMAVLKGVGQELVAASQALGKAAETLKQHGKIMPAQQAFLAGKRAAKAAQGISG